MLAGLDTKVRQAITEIVVSHREFRGMGGVLLPHRGRRWTPARPAPSRAPGPDLPTAWIHAATGAERTCHPDAPPCAGVVVTAGPKVIGLGVAVLPPLPRMLFWIGCETEQALVVNVRSSAWS